VTQETVLTEVAGERARQDEKWGQQSHPDGTDEDYQVIVTGMRAKVEAKARRGELTWRDILEEEIWEAYAEVDPAKLRVELTQAAAVIVAWIEAIDRRQGVLVGQEEETHPVAAG